MAKYRGRTAIFPHKSGNDSLPMGWSTYDLGHCFHPLTPLMAESRLSSALRFKGADFSISAVKRPDGVVVVKDARRNPHEVVG